MFCVVFQDLYQSILPVFSGSYIFCELLCVFLDTLTAFSYLPYILNDNFFSSCSLVSEFKPPVGFRRGFAYHRIHLSEMMFPGNVFQHHLADCGLPTDCPHVVVMVGLVCINDPWGYMGEPLMPEWSMVRRQTKRDTRVYATRVRRRFAFGTRLFIRRACASEPASA